MSQETYIVLKPFKDAKKYGNKTANVGNEIAGWDSERAQSAVKRGLLKLKEESSEDVSETKSTRGRKAKEESSED